MKKRLIGTLLLGALLVSSTSMFVSCKDYDDDINNVSDRVTVLEAAKVDLENKIATLRADLEANYATKVALADTAFKERARALAAEAALSTRIQTAQDAIDDLNALIGGDISKSANFADCKTYKAALEKTWAKIESVEAGLGDRLTKLETDLNLDNAESKLRVYLKNLENQIAALQTWQAELNADGGAATKNWVGKEISEAEGRAAIDAATKAAKALSDSKAYTDAQLAEKIAEALRTAAADAKAKADAAEKAAKEYADGKAAAAEKAAKEFAAAEAKAKADAAEAAAKEYAKTYADQKYNEALTEAQKKANAAEEAAKAYADGLLVTAKAYSDANLASAKTYADGLLTEAKTYADGKAAAAQTAAQEYADIQIGLAKTACNEYAEQMRDAAINSAKTFTNTEIQKLKDNELKAINNKIDDLQAELNVLDMFVKQLRSLVFIPEGYIDGVEALEVFSMNYIRYNHFTGSNWIDLGADDYWQNPEKSTVKNAYNEDGFDKTATNKQRNSTDLPSRYNSEAGLYRVLDFTAKYYMNPSNAQLDKVTKANVKPIVEDKWFDVTRGNIGMSVADIIKPNDDGGEKGVLQVQYKLTNPNLIATGNEITVFATSVAYGDTTITSDYATFRNKYIDSLQLAHAPKFYAPSYTEVKNTHHGKDPVITDDNIDHKDNLLFGTITAAAGKGENVKDETTGFDPQDEVAYTSAGLELDKLVETHYRDVNSKKHYWMKNIADYGLHYEFELTYLRYGSNNTSESAHAVLYKKDGKTYLVPWAPKKSSETVGANDGEPNAFNPETYEQDKAKFQTRQLIGRTPLVRVSLRDAEGNVLDYGYIRIKIVDVTDPVTPPSDLRRFVEYTANGYTYDIPWLVQKGCVVYNNPELNFQNSWIDQQIDIYAFAGISHAQFTAGWELEMDGNVAKQYAVSNKTNNQNDETGEVYRNGMAKFTALPTTTESALGEVTEVPNPSATMTNILQWTVSAAQAKAAFIDPATRPASRTIAVRYKSKDNNVAKDIYIIFNTGDIKITSAPEITGTINWDGLKNENYWFATNSHTERSGLDEAHAQVYGVEDNVEAKTSKLWSVIPALFKGNVIASTNDQKDDFITLANGGTYTGKDLTLRLEFVKGAKTSFKGIIDNNTKQFVPFPNPADKTELYAFRDDNKNGVQNAGEPDQLIAKLVYTDNNSQDINHMRIEYQKTDFAKALLNYAAHNELSDDVLTAYVAVRAKIGACEISLTGDPLNIRFLRPINVASNPATIEDASVNSQQVIYLKDLVSLTDWRDEPFKTNYWYYYGVTDIQIAGSNAGSDLSDNEDVLTNMTLDPADEPTLTLKSVSQMLDFTYLPETWTATDADTAPAQADFGKLVYKNLGSAVQKFKLQLPLRVKYIWGDVYTTVTVDVKCTKNNGARRFK